MDYVFRPAVQALINSGALQQMVSKTGELLPMAVNPQTGRIASLAVSAVSTATPLQPFIAPVQAAFGVANMVQTQMGFNAIAGQLTTIQSTLGILQSTTALIGVGTVAVGALSAVNLWQTLKLRQDVKRLHLDLKDGFLNLEQVVKTQNAEILERINAIPNEVEFRAHHQALVQAYGRFMEASDRISVAMKIEDASTRNTVLANIQQTLGESLADYRNPRLLSELCGVGKLRRFECAWAIDQAIAMTYQLQDAPAALSDHLEKLQDKIRRDILAVVDACELDEEIDFIFPEVLRIHNHDLAALNAWQTQVEWTKSLSPSEKELLKSTEIEQADFDSLSEASFPTVEIPPEQLHYEALKQKSHFLGLQDHLRLLMRPNLRLEYESYVSQEAAKSGHPALILSNLKQMSDSAIANLYWYFKIRDESEDAENLATA